MRLVSRLILILTLMVLLGAGGRAFAQQAQGSPAFDLLQQYALPVTAIPAGYSQISLAEVSNTAEAAQLRDPAAVQKLVSRGRTDGLEQILEPAAGTPSLIEIDLALYSDSAGAQADLGDTTSAPGFTLMPAPPALGDTSIDANVSAVPGGPQLQGQLLGFTSGRLEVLVTGLALSGSAAPDIQSVAALLSQQAAAAPPSAPAPAELATLQTETSPESILHDSYRLLLDNYLSSLTPAVILGSAYTGAANALTAAGASNLPAAPQITSSDAEGAWAQFLPAFQMLEQTGGTVSPQDLAYAAATEMYGHLNCHTEFFAPPAYSREVASLSGAAYIGIGVTRSLNPPNLILKVQPGTPADRAGLRPGDQILAVDHTQLASLSESAANLLFSGAVGEPITLTIQRPGLADPFDVTLVRQSITPQIEQHRILAGGIGYIELDQFVDGQEAVDDVRGALQDFAAAGNVNGWILDLRFDGGGSEQTMRQIADLFVPTGSLLDTDVQRDGTQTRLRTNSSPVPNQKPLVILVGPGTASAAELFTESIRDLGRATVIGSQTAGCVNGGQIFGLLDGSGVFVSTDQFLAGPQRVALEGVGVTPDQQVDTSLAQFAAGNDAQLAAAIAALGAH